MDILPWFLPARLDPWRQRAIHPRVARGAGPNSHLDLHRRIVAVEPPGPPVVGGPFERVAESIRHYQIFPPHLGTPLLQRAVQLGDCVGLRYHVFPGVHLVFASRVTALIDLGDDIQCSQGFTYQTLQGHPEVGEETFRVDKDLNSGAVVASLQAWSELNFMWLRPLEPLCRMLQLQAGRSALDHLEKVANHSSSNLRP